MTFEIGSGFTAAQRFGIWQHRDKHKGMLARFKFQQLTPDGIPRFPVFAQFRHRDDVS